MTMLTDIYSLSSAESHNLPGRLTIVVLFLFAVVEEEVFFFVCVCMARIMLRLGGQDTPERAAQLIVLQH